MRRWGSFPGDSPPNVSTLSHHIGVIQSLLVTCRLHDVDPYAYLVDVLQRIDQHPASRVDELVPRVWKETFAGDLLISDLRRVSQ